MDNKTLLGQVSWFSWVVLVETKFSGKNMLGEVLIVNCDLDYFISWCLLVETKFISTNMLVYNDVRLGFDNSCSFLMC